MFLLMLPRPVPTMEKEASPDLNDKLQQAFKLLLFGAKDLKNKKNSILLNF